MGRKEFLLGRLLIAGAAFALYVFSSGLLAAGWAGLLFGADAHLYGPIAVGEVYDRIFRFHPVTVLPAEFWMMLHPPFAGWVDPQTWLRFPFAAVGACGVWIAAGALARLVPRRLALVGGVLYALTLSVWFFSSIEESKIVSATLAALYISLWLRMRDEWTLRDALLLTLVLFVACLNEAVACFLIAVPAVDQLLRSGFTLRNLRWLFLHGLVFLPAFLILETLPERLLPVADEEGRSHFGMLFYYLARNEYSFAALYSFGLNWFLFSVAAPVFVEACTGCYVYFAPSLEGYFLNPWRTALLAWLCILLAATLIPKFQDSIPAGMRPFLAGLAAFSLLRGAFFFVFNPLEAMLYTPSVMLPHLMLFLAAFAATRIPAKTAMLAVLAVLLFIGNGLFVSGA